MIVVDTMRAVVVACLPLLALTGLLRFWNLVVVAVVLGSLGALFTPALQASLPVLAGDVGTLQATNGLMDMTRRLARAIGPGLAGLLIAVLPLAHFFTLDAVSFAVSALSIFALGSRFAWKPRHAEGLKREKGIKGLIPEIAGGISNGVWCIVFVVGVPLLVIHGLGNSIGAYGLIVGAYGIGNVLSNLVVGSLPMKRRVLSVFLGKGILGLGFLLLAFSTSVPMAFCACALAAIGGPMSDIMVLTMLQTDLPSD